MPHFVPRTTRSMAEHEPAYWFAFQGDKLLVHQRGDNVAVPRLSGLADIGLAAARCDYLGYLEDAPAGPIDCFAAEIAADAELPEGLAALGLRELGAELDDVMFAVAGRAIQIVAWDRTHRYCGQCGAATERLPTERAMKCPACGLRSYPRLSPAIIIAVVRHTPQGDQLLLGRNHRFPPGRYSVLAGYVEPGETLEDCAHREVFEETGIRIKNIRYFGSQPWPFPNSLMIGFTADYDGGNVVVEQAELADAGWFTADALPGLPPRMTIARRLIDWFAAGGRKLETGSPP